MTYDEGLRSYKAIAFIESLTKSYCKLGAAPQQNVSAKQNQTRLLSKRLGENLWIK
ncbi:MAG: hypothetical protein NWE93_14060 [Candidatus Bathyarchaeota archaeon]|nr:hypothetical protein [Candidatus Bathyarchaeota archaeon]